MSTLTEAVPAQFIAILSSELSVSEAQILSVAKLFAEGATVPFIARYRKEQTGSLDEVQIMAIRDRLQQLKDLETRRAAILKSLDERKLLTPALEKSVKTATTMTRLEDIFAPYRPKRRTRAMIAAEKGLTPLADFLWDSRDDAQADPDKEAFKFLVTTGEEDKLVPEVKNALAGARDILAERFSDDAEAKASLRSLYENDAMITSKILSSKKDEPAAAKFKDYFDWSESLANVPSHRLLAMRRGEKEGFLLMRIQISEDQAVNTLRSHFVVGSGSCGDQVDLALIDSFKRLSSLSLETEFRMKSKKGADSEAINVFADNIRELLLAAPLGQKRTLAIDPAFRTGCKTVVLDAQGALLFDTVLFLTSGPGQLAEAISSLKLIVEKFKIEAIAIGNGTASRETEAAVRGAGLPGSITIVQVNESGASIYSASEVARDEFPDKDVTVRGAVSIGRRLMDPLAELVKLDPKSIGVGQYQHDVEQNRLKVSLDDTVMSCVNGVGVELNTASKQLLSYVSGLNSTHAANIIAFREKNGAFQSRDDLKKVPRFGEKTFEQAAGFLRIHGSSYPLDSSAVHPERYSVVEQIAGDLGVDVKQLMGDASLHKKVKLQNYVSEEVGLPTLKDILEELAKPGRDPRAQFEVFSFAEGVAKPSDLIEGMKLPGIVTNVTKFGAFVDIGVHQDGLVHISQLADKYVEDPADVVKVGQKVQVAVTELDLSRNRISLTMRADGGREERRNNRNDRRDSNQRNQGGGQRPHRPRQQQNNDFGGNWFDNALKKKH